MPGSKNYKRDYKREYELQKKRGEVGGSDSYNSKQKRARRKYEAENGKIEDGKDYAHKKSNKSGGSTSESNMRPEDRSTNRSKGGKSGSRKGKAKGGKK